MDDGRLKAAADSGCASVNSIRVLKAAEIQDVALVQRLAAT